MKIIFCMLAAFLLSSCASQGKPSVQQISSKSAFTLEFATHYCSATAISSNVILSAGHCFLTDEAVTFKIDGREARVIKIARDGRDHVLVMVNIAF